MKHSKLSGRGYLVIDHSASPGLTAEENARAGRPAEAAGSGFFEADVICCGHCPLVLIVNPGGPSVLDSTISSIPADVPIMISNPLRTRPRGWCKYCDRYLCDACAAVYAGDGQCRDIKAQVDHKLEEAFQLLNIKEI